jgi:hypothetical protein
MGSHRAHLKEGLTHELPQALSYVCKYMYVSPSACG